MNFVMFPMFFSPRRLYPLWKLREGGSESHLLGVGRQSLYACGGDDPLFALRMFDPVSALVVCGSTVLFFLLAVIGYDPQRGMLRRTAQPV